MNWCKNSTKGGFGKGFFGCLVAIFLKRYQN
ncbi:MAG: hypothetical protein ACI8QY_001029, partial [bacterium]